MMREPIAGDPAPHRPGLLARLLGWLGSRKRPAADVIEPPTDPARARANAERYRRISGEQRARRSGGRRTEPSNVPLQLTSARYGMVALRATLLGSARS